MSYETDIVEGLAEHLAAVLPAEWQPSGVYTPGAGPAAIVVRMLPDLQRDLITLSSYPVSDQWGPNDSVLGVQVRTRAEAADDPRLTDELDDAVYAALHGLSHLRLLGHPVTKVARQSGASMGQDSNRRWQRSSNYYVTGPR